jgi:hypothetical protein
MLVRTLATHLLNRQVARRITRVIPHPGLRVAATIATSIVAPIIVKHVLGATARRGWRLPFSRPVPAEARG